MEKNNLFEFLKEEQKRHREDSDKYRRDANNIFFELPKHLVLTATVFIALSSPIIALKDAKNMFNYSEKYVLVSSLTLITISIFIGLVQYIKDYNFFKKRVLFSTDITRKIKKNEFKSILDYNKGIDIKKKDLGLESAKWPLITQSVILLIGVLGFMVFISMILF
jgi:hypothetical protein